MKLFIFSLFVPDSFPLIFVAIVPTVRRVPPRFSIPPSNCEVMPAGSVNLTCVAVGSPMPVVKWMNGEVELNQEDERPLGRNILQLTNIQHSANYTCVAISTLGVIETTAQVLVKGMKLTKLFEPLRSDESWFKKRR